MLKSMIVKELLTLFRLKTLIVSIILFTALLVLAFYSAAVSYENTRKQINSSNDLFRKQWEQLTIGNTHGAAHFGTWLFKPSSLLSIFDGGITDYTGIAYRVEAHRQHDLLVQTATVTANYLRFGSLTMATLLQVILPLLLIFLLFDVFTSEKRMGTLSLLYIQGAGKKIIITGKLVAALLLTLLLLIPVMLLLLIAGFINFDSSVSLPAIGYLLGGYLLYSSFFAFLSVGISIVSRSSRQSLLTLLGSWFLLVIVLPRITAGIQERQYPLPSPFALQKKISDAEKMGIDGMEPLLARKKKLVDSLLNRYQVNSPDQLPVNTDAIYMQSEEDYLARIYKKFTAETDSLVLAQNKYENYARWLDPFFAIREWSMAFSGTDIDHLLDFREQAVTYRNDFIRQLNNKLAETRSNAHSNDNMVTAAFYKNMQPFMYRPLPLSKVLHLHKSACYSLLWWLLLAGLYFTWLINRKNML